MAAEKLIEYLYSTLPLVDHLTLVFLFPGFPIATVFEHAPNLTVS